MEIHIELLGRCVAIWVLVHVKGDHVQMLSVMNVNSMPNTGRKRIFGNACSLLQYESIFKGTVHPKMMFLSLFTPLNPCDFLSSVEQKYEPLSVFYISLYEIPSYRFAMTRWWVNNDRIFHFKELTCVFCTGVVNVLFLTIHLIFRCHKMCLQMVRVELYCLLANDYVKTYSY